MAITIPAGQTRPIPTGGFVPPNLLSVIGNPGESGAVSFSLIFTDGTDKNFLISYPGSGAVLIDKEISLMATYHYGKSGTSASINIT
jgi:hypothetical protein